MTTQYLFYVVDRSNLHGHVLEEHKRLRSQELVSKLITFKRKPKHGRTCTCRKPCKQADPSSTAVELLYRDSGLETGELRIVNAGQDLLGTPPVTSQVSQGNESQMYMYSADHMQLVYKLNNILNMSQNTLLWSTSTKSYLLKYCVLRGDERSF